MRHAYPPIMDRVGRTLGTSGAADPPTASVPEPIVPAEAGGRPAPLGAPPGVRGHRIRPPDGDPMEGLAHSAVWECQFHPQILPGVEAGRGVRRPLTSGARRIRRARRDRLAVAEHRHWQRESAAGPGGRGTQPHGSGKKRAPSAASWSTPVESRCRYASAEPIGMTSASSCPPWTGSSVRGPFPSPTTVNTCVPIKGTSARRPLPPSASGGMCPTSGSGGKPRHPRTGTGIPPGAGWWSAPCPGSTGSGNCWSGSRSAPGAMKRYWSWRAP